MADAAHAQLVVSGLQAWYGESHILHGVDFKVNHAPRRAGDPAAIVAKAERVRKSLGWRPKRDDLDAIVRQALDWERRLHNRLGPPDPV